MHFTNNYVNAQVVHTPTATVAASASTHEKGLRLAMVEAKENTRDVAAAAKIGKLLGERLQAKGVPAISVFFKREQRYHGKVKAVIDSVREAGIELFLQNGAMYKMSLLTFLVVLKLRFKNKSYLVQLLVRERWYPVELVELCKTRAGIKVYKKDLWSLNAYDDYVGETIQCLSDFGIEDKICVVTVHSYLDFDEVVDVNKSKLVEKKRLQLDGQLFRLSCCADMFSSMVKKGFGMIEDIISDIRLIVCWGKSLPVWNLTFLKLQEALESSMEYPMSDSGSDDSDTGEDLLELMEILDDPSFGFDCSD
ncbi:hypothetical protein RND71_013084 [Anisodus tanguticus]|uniref:Uncharacterized protein n=1 Tax=Anisodus tanguticus TaxID=243964 RepID=A0AAE1VHJ9_9SOLA|nr:hypothetical protein RND71_013084 [Anisodus tanguticus]